MALRRILQWNERLESNGKLLDVELPMNLQTTTKAWIRGEILLKYVQ